LSNVKEFLLTIKLKIKKTMMKINNTKIRLNKIENENSTFKKSIILVAEKQIAKKIDKLIKFIGLDLFKKLASIDSFVIFAP
jgi:hypothetical protein